jgi:protein O-mannosyl-transferase
LMASDEGDSERTDPAEFATAQAAPKSAPARASWEVVVPSVLLLTGAAWVVYGTAMRAPFIFDDRISVVQNPSITKLWPLLGEDGGSGPLTPLKDSVTAGRPLVNLSLALNYHFGRLNPQGYHAFNLAVHVLSALLLWGIVGRALRLDFFGGRFAQAAGPLSLMVALVWELHPLQTDAVEYVSQRTELMMAFFYLATLYASLRYWAAPSVGTRRGWLVVATIACMLGMACKEVMVTAPVIVLLFERTFIAGTFRKAVRESWPLYLGLGLGWILLLAINYGGPRSASAGFHAGFGPYLWWLTQAKILWMYLRLAVWPWPLVIHYEMPYLATLAMAWQWVLLGGLLVAGTLLLLWRRRAAGFLGAWVLLILSPTLVVPLPSEMAAERRMYLPLAGLVSLAIVGGYALLEWLREPGLAVEGPADQAPADEQVIAAIPAIAEPVDANGPSHGLSSARVTVVSACILATVFGLVSMRRLSAYRDLVSLWQDTAIHQPDNAIVLSSLGAALTGAGRHEEAIQALQHAADVQTDSAGLGIHKQWGAALSAVGRTQEAIEQLQIALRVDPNASGVERLLGLNLLNAGQTANAIEYLQKALQRQPNDAGILDNLGAALLNGNRLPEAIACFGQALQLAPDNVGIRFNLALAYAKAGRPTEAVATAEEAMKMARSAGSLDVAGQIDAWLTAYRNSLPAQ